MGGIRLLLLSWLRKLLIFRFWLYSYNILQ